jgi:ribosomal protein L7/L12
MPIPADPLPAKVLDALQRGNAIEAIKLLRESTGLGLKEAKDVIDEHLRGKPSMAPAASAGRIPSSVAEALQRGNKIEAIRLMREHTGLGLKEAKDAVDRLQQETEAKLGKLSPGEVPSSGSSLWQLVALAVVCIAAYYFLRGPS